MTELETLERAKMYIDKLAGGINPLDDSVIPEDDVVNNIRLARCFFYVSKVLGQVIDRKIEISPRQKSAFNITFDEIQRFPFSDTPITATKIAELINSLVDTQIMNKITYRNITEWLINIGILEIQTESNGKHSKRPTATGNEIGIYTEERSGRKGCYTVVLYNNTAQKFIIDNMDAIVSFIDM